MSPSPQSAPVRWLVTDGRQLVLSCATYAEAVLACVIVSARVPDARVVASPMAVLEALGLADRPDALEMARVLWRAVREEGRRGAMG